MKKRIAVIFGGRSGEHEVSIVSAKSVISALDKEKYEVVPVAVTKDGRWLGLESSEQMLLQGSADNPREIIVSSRTEHGKLVATSNDGSQSFNVVIPLIHGTSGEDGCLQGFLELVNVPYVGCGVLASAVGMDKIIQKHILAANNIPVVPFIEVRASDWNDNQEKAIAEIQEKLVFPLFAKPANAGSSLGVTKIHDTREIKDAVSEALKYDMKAIIEQGVPNAREIECSVLGNNAPKASVLGEVKPSNEFYDYDSKYIDGKSELSIPAGLNEDLSDTMRKTAVSAFKALDCSGMARVDFLLNRETNEWFLNEINTIPGFTSISMYPMLWDASGLSYPALLDELVGLAEERFKQKNSLHRSYQPSSNWHVSEK